MHVDNHGRCIRSRCVGGVVAEPLPCSTPSKSRRRSGPGNSLTALVMMRIGLPTCAGAGALSGGPGSWHDLGPSRQGAEQCVRHRGMHSMQSWGHGKGCHSLWSGSSKSGASITAGTAATRVLLTECVPLPRRRRHALAGDCSVRCLIRACPMSAHVTHRPWQQQQMPGAASRTSAQLSSSQASAGGPHRAHAHLQLHQVKMY